jgi:serine/threonine protein kinase
MKAYTEDGLSITIADKNEIKRGGEGKILTIPEMSGHVAKIYLDPNNKHMSQAQKDALKVLDASVFVRPQALIYPAKKSLEILGFVMEYLSNDFVPLAALFNKNFCASYQIDLPRKQKIAEQMVAAVALAHRNDITIGDLSGLNILVTPDGEVRFIDVDAYETPIHTHSGLLLDEIRDYLYQGRVSQESDYFALAVILFNLFTYTHPFKGVHKQYRSIAERMLHKIPVFAQDPELITPKCFMPIVVPDLQMQFERIFVQGERFLLSLSSQPAVVAAPSMATTLVLSQDRLVMKELYTLAPGERIEDAYFTDTLGYLSTNQRRLVWDTIAQGSPQRRHETNADEWEAMYVGKTNCLARRHNQLWMPQSGGKWTPITNFQLHEGMRTCMVDSVLVCVDEEYLRYVFVDELLQTNVRVEQVPVFGKGFTLHPGGVMQHVGEVSYVFYHSGKTLSSFKAGERLQQVFISGTVGIASFIQTLQQETSLRHEYFSINGLQMQLSGQTLSHHKQVAFKPTPQGGLVFEPADDQLIIRSAQDFQILQTMDCRLLSDQTRLFATQSGIIAVEPEFVYVLNTK